MKYEVTDSHRKMSKRTKKALTDFFCEVKGIPRDAAEGQTGFCDWYEKDYAVKWFEVTAWEDGAVVGYLRCLRDPNDVRRWYVGDVHVRVAFFRKGVATAMYELMIATVQEYEAAEKLIAAIKRDNVRSIGLHKKCAVERMLPVYSAWRKLNGNSRKAADRKALCGLLQRAEEGIARFESIWCGNRLVGFRMDDGSGEVVFNEQETETGGRA